MGFLDSTGLTRLWNKIKSKFVTGISYDSTTRKLKQTINGVSTDVATLNTMKIVTVTQNGTSLHYGELNQTEYNAILEAIPNVILHVIRYSDATLYLQYQKMDPDTTVDDYLYFTGTYANQDGCVVVEGKIAKYEFPNAGEHSVIIQNTATYSTTEISRMLNQRQPLLTFDDTPTENSNNPIKSSGVKNYVDNAIQEVTEIAEGKTKNYVISDAVTSGAVNDSFNTNNETIVAYLNYNNNKIKDVNGNFIPLSDLKVGDIISIIETEVSDRWVGSVTSTAITFYKMEIKLDIVNNVIQNDTRPVSSGAVYTSIQNVYTYIQNYNVIDLSVNVDPIPTVGLATISDSVYNQINAHTVLKCTLKDPSGNIVTNYYTLFRKDSTHYIFGCLMKKTSQTINGCLTCTLPTINIRHTPSGSSQEHPVAYDYYIWQLVCNITALPSSKMSAEVQASLAKADNSVQSSDFITDAEIDAVCV